VETQTPLPADSNSDSTSAGAEPSRKHFPILTWLTCITCGVVFAGLSVETKQESWDVLSKWGYYPVDEIRSGAYWALLTSVFVHLELWHVVFNIYWLYVLGARLELAIGSWRWLAFVFGAAIISSGAELGVSDDTGIGASGVAYGFFGFMWICRDRFPGFRQVLDRRTVALFILWLGGCLFLTLTKVWEVGNAAHIAGMAFGAGTGAALLFEHKRVAIVWALTVLGVSALVPLFWAPWSSNWTGQRAIRAYEKGDYDAAIKWYQRSLQLGQDEVWCWSSLALAYYAKGDQQHYAEVLKTLRKLDSKAAEEVEDEIRSEKNE